MSTAHPSAPLPVPAHTPNAAPGLASLWVAAGVGAALVVALFAESFRNLVILWERDQNYSHGYLVAAISLGYAVVIARRVGLPSRGELVWGLSGIALGVLCQLAVTVLRWPILSYAGLVCVLRGLLVCAGGRRWASAFNFPLVFLFFMFPLPVLWTGYAALWLQDVVSRVSETALGLFVVCHRVGHTIRIAGVDKSLVVAEECSGLGQIVSFVAFAVLLGQLLARPLWYRLALVAAAVPVAVAANTLRVVLMNLAAVQFGTKWMGGRLHDAPALFSIPVGVVLFLLCDRMLNGIVERRSQAAPPADAPSATTEPVTPPSVGRGALRSLVAGVCAVGVGVAVQLALTAHVRSAGEVSYPELGRPLNALPLQLVDPATGQPAWAGADQTEQADAIRKKLPFHADDLLVRAYRHTDGTAVQLYAVHSRAGEDRKHHPEICIRDVSGAPEDLGFRKGVPLRSDGPAAQRFRFQTGAGRAVVVYYWHYTLRPAPDPTRTPLQLMHQRVGVTAPSVTVQVSVGTDDPRSLAAVETLLIPGLDAGARAGLLPPGTEAGSGRVPIALARTR